jgi:hypothetical protein
VRLLKEGIHVSSKSKKRVKKSKNKIYKNRFPNKGKINRSPYYRYYRSERLALSSCELAIANSRNLNHKNNRAVRFIYYCVLPHLTTCLMSCEYDYSRCKLLEKTVYNSMLSYRYNSSCGKYVRYPRILTEPTLPKRVPVWMFRQQESA